MAGFKAENLKLTIVFNMHHMHIIALMTLHNTTINMAIHYTM